MKGAEEPKPSNKGQAGRDLHPPISSTPIWSFGKRIALICFEDIAGLRKLYLGDGRGSEVANLSGALLGAVRPPSSPQRTDVWPRFVSFNNL
jgi:hypothetical protein